MAGTPENDPAQSRLSTQDQLRLWRALGAMPEAAHCRPRDPSDVTVEDLTARLEKLAAWIQHHFEQGQELESQVAEYKNLFRGGQRLFSAIVNQEFP